MSQQSQNHTYNKISEEFLLVILYFIKNGTLYLIILYFSSCCNLDVWSFHIGAQLFYSFAHSSTFSFADTEFLSKIVFNLVPAWHRLTSTKINFFHKSGFSICAFSKFCYLFSKLILIVNSDLFKLMKKKFQFLPYYRNCRYLILVKV